MKERYCERAFCASRKLPYLKGFLKIRLFISSWFILGIWKLFPKKKPISLELEDFFASDAKMKESPTSGECDKAVETHVKRLDEIKVEPDNPQVSILPYFLFSIVAFNYKF